MCNQFLDADYEAFLENLNKKIEPFPSAEVYVEEMEQNKSAGKLYLFYIFIFYVPLFVHPSCIYSPILLSSTIFIFVFTSFTRCICTFRFKYVIFIGATEKVQTPLTEFLNKKKAARNYSRQNALILVMLVFFT